jgi:hypothetical protein
VQPVANTYTDSRTNHNTYRNSDTNSNGNSDVHRDTNAHGDADCDTKAYSHTQAASSPAAAPDSAGVREIVISDPPPPRLLRDK